MTPSAQPYTVAAENTDQEDVMPDEPLITIATLSGETIQLTAAEADLYTRLLHGGDGDEAIVIMRALSELGALRHRLETTDANLTSFEAELQATADPRPRLQARLNAALDADGGPALIRDYALALAALGGPPPSPDSITDGIHAELEDAARDLSRVLARFTVDDFAGRLEDLVPPLNAIDDAVKALA